MRKSMVILITILTFFMLFMNAIPKVIAGTDSMRVFLFIEERDIYRVGETIDFTVYVLDKGEYITPHSINIKINDTNRLSISDLVKISTGIYEGTYELVDDDAPYGYATINVEATYYNNQDSLVEDMVITVRSSEYVPSEFVVTVMVDDPSDYNPRPGSTIEITITTSDGDTLVDPDIDPITDKMLDLSIHYPGYYRTLEYTRFSTGVYKAFFVVDPTMIEDTYISITATASYEGSESTHSIGVSIDFYNVWIRKIYVRNTSASFELWISNLEGKVVPGAFIDLTSPTNVQKTTDVSGRANFAISYPEPELNYISIRGAVKAAGKTQNFEAKFSTGIKVTPSSQFNTHPGKFDVFYIEEENAYDPGQEVNRRYIAFNDTINWTNEMVYYYVVFQPQLFSYEGYLIASGNETTDENGIFTVNFTAPNEEGMFIVYFEAGTDPSNYTNDGKFYKEHLDYSTIFNKTSDTKTLDPDLHINVGGFVGTKATVTASREASSGYIGKVDWIIENLTWSQLSGTTATYLRRDGDGFTGNIVFPEFLPKGDNYTVVVTLIDPVTGETHKNSISIKPSKTAGVSNQLESYIASLIIIVVLVIVLTAYMLKRRQKKERLESERRELLGDEEE